MHACNPRTQAKERNAVSSRPAQATWEVLVQLGLYSKKNITVRRTDRHTGRGGHEKEGRVLETKTQIRERRREEGKAGVGWDR